MGAAWTFLELFYISGMPVFKRHSYKCSMPAMWKGAVGGAKTAVWTG